MSFIDPYWILVVGGPVPIPPRGTRIQSLQACIYNDTDAGPTCPASWSVHTRPSTARIRCALAVLVPFAGGSLCSPGTWSLYLYGPIACPNTRVVTWGVLLLLLLSSVVHVEPNSSYKSPLNYIFKSIGVAFWLNSNHSSLLYPVQLLNPHTSHHGQAHRGDGHRQESPIGFNINQEIKLLVSRNPPCQETHPALSCDNMIKVDMCNDD